jgi:hypothetical protein
VTGVKQDTCKHMEEKEKEKIWKIYISKAGFNPARHVGYEHTRLSLRHFNFIDDAHIQIINNHI